MELVLLIGAILVIVFIVSLLLKVVRVAISTIILIVVLAVILQLVFGIGAEELWQTVQSLLQSLWSAGE